MNVYNSSRDKVLGINKLLRDITKANEMGKIQIANENNQV